MKKIIFAVMAVFAISFSACGNKTQQGEAVDSVAMIDSMATAFANEDIDIITKHLEAGDVAKLQEILGQVKQKIATLIKENPELAKEYVEEFRKNIGEPLQQEVGELRKEVKELKDAVEGINDCPYRAECPVRDRMRHGATHGDA